jgi:acyl carrier protein
MVVEDRLRAFISEQVRWDPSSGELPSDYPLLQTNLIDSLGLFNLVSFLESEFGIEVGDAELVPEHFGTIAGIARLVESKRA